MERIRGVSTIGGLFAAAAAAIMLVWQWLGSSVGMPASPLSQAEKIPCMSYTPFRGNQSPFGADIPVDPAQIEQDLAQLKPITSCVRTYSVDHGLDQIAPIAQRYGMKVLQGLWLSSSPELNRRQIETAVDLAKRFPDVIAAIVVGNEVLLRGEMSPADLADTIRQVRAQVTMPVTYADVWAFWLRHAEIAPEVDFITIHILPYWEDIPLPSRDAAAYVNATRAKVAAAFPRKEIFIGEFGWPTAGRMREGAQASPIDQALAMHEVLAAAHRENYRVNLIEAYDQPWKRELEGTVGGHWGLYDAYRRLPKFAWGGSVSNHPFWVWQAVAGGVLATVAFLAAFLRDRYCRTRSPPQHSTPLAPEPQGEPCDTAQPFSLWARVALIAAVSGSFIGLTLADIPLESLTAGDWVRSLAWASLAVIAPVLSAAALADAAGVPDFARVLNGKVEASLDLGLGILVVGLGVLATQAALGLVFDPRYRDFPFAPLIGAVAPLLLLGKWRAGRGGPLPERVMGLVLLMAAVYIIWNEGLANWQACLFAGGLTGVSALLLRARDAQG